VHSVRVKDWWDGDWVALAYPDSDNNRNLLLRAARAGLGTRPTKGATRNPP